MIRLGCISDETEKDRDHPVISLGRLKDAYS
jgi:hypothetical protein